jgi:hypothetical protein
MRIHLFNKNCFFIMKNTFLSFAILLVIFSGCTKSEKQTTSETLADTTAVQPVLVDLATLLANPTQYDGKEVAVEGTVVHVCKHSGKRLHLIGADEATKLRIEAGEIGQFAKELEGSDIIAKGVFHVTISAPKEPVVESAEAKGGKTDECTTDGKVMEASQGEPEEMQVCWVDGISFETKAAE